MFKKIAVASLTVAVVATATVTSSSQQAEAKNGQNAGAFAAGAIIGLATGAIVGSQAQPRYYSPQPVYVAPPRRCHREAVQRWNPYQGRYVVVSYRKVCY
ncbi:tyrosyl-tRNA synthetase [Roseibium sp.]|uniref:tyrosyl-tRNA synthetase n=1 Tax=Roseibium sp. TaxID=1936156 RepID=UPI003A981A23